MNKNENQQSTQPHSAEQTKRNSRRFPIFGNKLSPIKIKPVETINEIKTEPKQAQIHEQDEVIKIQFNKISPSTREQINLEKEFYGDQKDNNEGKSKSDNQLRDQFHINRSMQILRKERGKQDQFLRVDRFCRTETFKDVVVQPSFLFRNSQLVINQQSDLFRSITILKEQFQEHTKVKKSFETEILGCSKRMKQSLISSDQIQSKIQKIDQFIQNFKQQSEEHQIKLLTLSKKVDQIQKQQQKLKKTQKFKAHKDAHNIEQQIYRQQEKSDEDEFAESHILPIGMINDMFTKHQKQKQEIQTKCNKFHPILKMNQKKLESLQNFVKQELQDELQNQFKFNLIYRRSSNSQQRIGVKQNLDQKPHLVFILKTSTAKTIGGYVSYPLYQNETISDEHAFIFSLSNDECFKFKVLQDEHYEAASSSKDYLICFGTDLMISANSIQEESYSEWPTIFESHEKYQNEWFSGGFEFNVEAIDVFQVIFDKN